MKSFTIKANFPVPPQTLYEAWLSSKQHSAMTGSKAVCSAKVKGKFTAWDGYISGKNTSLEPNCKIIQAWRTTEFSDSDPDSEIIIEFIPTTKGSTLTISHNNIPKGQPDYKKGWMEYYFKPMKAYFK